VKYEDDLASKLVVAVDGVISVTNDDKPGVTISGRLEPLTGANTSGWQFRTVDRQVSTTMTGFVAAGASRIPVASIAGFQIGSEVVIDAGGPAEESNRIEGFGSILLETPTQFDHDVGATVSSSHIGDNLRLRIQNGKLVVNRIASSTSVEGSGTREVSEGEPKDETAFPIVAIVIVAAVIGGVGLVMAITCLVCKRRAPPTMATVEIVDKTSIADQNFEHVVTPKLLGATQRSSSNASIKKSRGTLATPSFASEDVLEIAFEHSQKQLQHSNTVSADLVGDTMDDEHSPEQLQHSNTVSADLVGDTVDDEVVETQSRRSTSDPSVTYKVVIKEGDKLNTVVAL
jgi:hypothetical protein